MIFLLLLDNLVQILHGQSHRWVHHVLTKGIPGTNWITWGWVLFLFSPCPPLSLTQVHYKDLECLSSKLVPGNPWHWHSANLLPHCTGAEQPRDSWDARHVYQLQHHFLGCRYCWFPFIIILLFLHLVSRQLFTLCSCYSMPYILCYTVSRSFTAHHSCTV